MVVNDKAVRYKHWKKFKTVLAMIDRMNDGLFITWHGYKNVNAETDNRSYFQKIDVIRSCKRIAAIKSAEKEWETQRRQRALFYNCMCELRVIPDFGYDYFTAKERWQCA